MQGTRHVTLTMRQPLLSPVRAERIFADAARLRAGRRLALLAFLLIVSAYVWIISAGRLTEWPQYSARYNMLAQAFLHRQCSLRSLPPPRLLQLPDPYDPVANHPYRSRPGIGDTCLYDGKLYLYWGPVPALLLAPIALWPGYSPIADQYIVFAFALALLWVMTRLLLRVWERHFPDAPPWTLLAALLVGGLAMPLPSLVARAAVYEGAILGGQLFLLGGIWLAFNALSRDAKSDGALDARPPLPGALPLLLSGASLAAAVGCRVSLALAVPAAAVFVLGWMLRDLLRARGQGNRELVRSYLVRMALFSLPLLTGAVLLGAYNYVRFGSWHEFGQKYQLANANLRSYDGLFSVANVWPGLFSYFLRPIHLGGPGAVVSAVPGTGTFPSFIHLPPHYESFESITGILWVTPFLLLAALPIIYWLLRAPRHDRARSDSRPGNGSIDWLTGCLISVGVLGFAPVLCMIGSSQRYLADLTPALLILAAIGVWQGSRVVAGRAVLRRFFFGSVSLLTIISLVLGVLLTLDGTSEHFQVNNPQLFYRLCYRPSSRGAASTNAPVMNDAESVRIN